MNQLARVWFISCFTLITGETGKVLKILLLILEVWDEKLTYGKSCVGIPLFLSDSTLDTSFKVKLGTKLNSTYNSLIIMCETTHRKS